MQWGKAIVNHSFSYQDYISYCQDNGLPNMQSVLCYRAFLSEQGLGDMAWQRDGPACIPFFSKGASLCELIPYIDLSVICKAREPNSYLMQSSC